MQQLRTSTTTITLLQFTTRNCTLLPTLLLYHSFENYNKSRIKDFRSRHNETRLYYLHLFKLTLDERKTLTKVSTRTTSHNHSPKQAHTSDEVGKPANVSQTFHQRERKKGCLHNWWRIRSIRISSRNNERIKKTTRLVLYQTLHYFLSDYLNLVA